MIWAYVIVSLSYETSSEKLFKKSEITFEKLDMRLLKVGSNFSKKNSFEDLRDVESGCFHWDIVRQTNFSLFNMKLPRFPCNVQIYMSRFAGWTKSCQMTCCNSVLNLCTWCNFIALYTEAHHVNFNRLSLTINLLLSCTIRINWVYHLCNLCRSIVTD